MLESCPGGFPKHNPLPSLDGFLAWLGCWVTSQPTLSFRRFPNTWVYQTRLQTPRVIPHSQSGATGRESPTAGSGHSPQSSLLRRDSITLAHSKFPSEIPTISPRLSLKITYLPGSPFYKGTPRRTNCTGSFPRESMLEISSSISRKTSKASTTIAHSPRPPFFQMRATV